MPKSRKVTAGLVLLMTQFCLSGAPYSTLPLSVMAQKADIVVIATVQNILNNSESDAQVELQVTKVVKGQLASLVLTAGILPPQPGVSKAEVLPRSLLGVSGLWFLKSGSSVYQILPMAQGDFRPQDIFLPVAASTLAASTSTVTQQLLACLVSWYRSRPIQTAGDDDILLVNLASVSSQESLAAASLLTSAVSTEQKIIGLSAAIRQDSDSAVSSLAGQLASLSSSPKFWRITEAMADYYKPRTATALNALQQLAELHTSVSGVDDAVASALQKYPSRVAVLPAAAALLESKDPQAQLRAATIFSYCSLFADSKGQIRPGNRAGPFMTAETRRMQPRRDSTISTAQYAQFWLGWWSQNREKLGFPPAQ